MVSLGIQVLLVLAVTYGGVQADIKVACLISASSNSSVHAQPECLMPRDCKEWHELGVRKDGIYPVNPGNDDGFQVYCDMTTDEGGWTVFQRRQDGSVDFYRKWVEYEEGFGDLNGEFWLGLEKIHRLTRHTKTHSLRVEMTTSSNFLQFAEYSSFRIKDGTTANHYMLEVGGYTGTAGDGLSVHNGSKFSTYDKDNDSWGSNCAESHKGAWWYYACHRSNLNGDYNSPLLQWGLSGTVVKATEMKAREN